MFVLTLPKGIDRQTLTPLTVTSNWKTEWQMPDYSIGSLGVGSELAVELLPPLAFFNQREANGRKYCLIKPILQATIDATVLRVSSLHELGRKFLYSDNLFAFGMGNPSEHGSPPTILPDLT